MISLEFPIVRYHIVKGPAFVSKLSPVVQVLFGSHTAQKLICAVFPVIPERQRLPEHIVVYSTAATKNLSTNPTMNTASSTFLARLLGKTNCTMLEAYLWNSFIVPIVLGLAPELGEHVWCIDQQVVQSIAASFQDSYSNVRIFCKTSRDDQTSCTSSTDDVV